MLTVNVTGTAEVLPFPVTVIVPVNVPAANPETLDDTVSVAGVVPVDGETLNHGAPLTLAVYVLLGLVVIDRLWEPGDAPIALAENDSEVGLTASVPAAAETFKVTGTLTYRSSPKRIRIVPV